MLNNYMIPPKFFGPAYMDAFKLFQDDNLQQFNYQDCTYIVDLPREEKAKNKDGKTSKRVVQNGNEKFFCDQVIQGALG